MSDPRLWGNADEPRRAQLYRRMRAIRRFEERLLELFDEGLLRGTTHCCIGQEADAVGVVHHLSDGDHLFSHHRGHGHYLAWTGDTLGLLTEIMGKQSGVVGGIGGSQHIAAPGYKSNGVLGGTVPAAAGIAWQRQLAGDGISVVFIGDGTMGEGVVYETLNIARLWRLPLWVVVEDNAWAQSTAKHRNMAGSIRARFEAFDWPVAELESTDVEAIDALAEEQVALMRRDGGPRALILHTYRLCHHSKNDDARPKEEVDARWEFEPLRIQGARLDDAVRQSIDEQVEAALHEVETQARGLP